LKQYDGPPPPVDEFDSVFFARIQCVVSIIRHSCRRQAREGSGRDGRAGGVGGGRGSRVAEKLEIAASA